MAPVHAIDVLKQQHGIRRHLIYRAHQAAIVKLREINGVDAQPKVRGQRRDQRGLPSARQTMEQIASMVWNSQLFVPLSGFLELSRVLM